MRRKNICSRACQNSFQATTGGQKLNMNTIMPSLAITAASRWHSSQTFQNFLQPPHPPAKNSFAMELHRRVPADKWCVTFNEFLEFVEDVRFAWELGQIGGIPASSNDSERGPNLYLVNEHYVKPTTLAKGGMSYALWLHPEGLPCQVFVSHAWVEGIFEFVLGVESAWPGGFGLRNMYCCLLANPQNLDLELFLNVDLVHSPFAKALAKASHLLVVPNSQISIYSRLWCVYEAYLGISMSKICLMPAIPSHRLQRASLLRLLLAPLLCGFVVGGLWRFLIMPRFGKAGVLEILLFSGLLSLVATVSAMIPPQLKMCMRTLLAVHGLAAWLAMVAAIPYWSIPYDEDLTGMGDFLRNFIPFAVFLFDALCMSHLNLQLLEMQLLSDQARNLSCHTVQAAQCTNPTDERRIREAIAGAEEDVDVAIHVLMLAGAYTSTLRRSYESGEDIRGAGIFNLKAKVFIGALLWFMSGIDSCTRLAPGGIERTASERHWAFMAIISAFFTAAVMPLWFRLSTHGPDWKRQTLLLWISCGISGLISPYFFGLFQGKYQFETLAIVQRTGWGDAHHPSLELWLVETFSVPVFSLISFTGACIGSQVEACRRGPYERTRQLVHMASESFSSLSSVDRRTRGSRVWSCCSSPSESESESSSDIE